MLYSGITSMNQRNPLKSLDFTSKYASIAVNAHLIARSSGQVAVMAVKPVLLCSMGSVAFSGYKIN